MFANTAKESELQNVLVDFESCNLLDKTDAGFTVTVRCFDVSLRIYEVGTTHPVPFYKPFSQSQLIMKFKIMKTETCT